MLFISEISPGSLATSGPDEPICQLNHLFYAFDGIVAEFNLKRVETTGDGYFAIGGGGYARKLLM